MDPSQNNLLHRNDNFALDLESVEFPPDVFNLPVGSFNEDSPQRGQSSDSDERARRRSSPPRASPAIRQPPLPLYHDSHRERMFNPTYPPETSPPRQARRAPESQFSYYPEPPDWYSPPPMEQPASYYGETPRRSPIQMSTPSRGGAEFFQQTPSRPAPFPFVASPARDYDSLNLMATPKGTLGEEFSPVGYDESLPLGMTDHQLGDKLDFSERKPSSARGAPPLQSPLTGFLQDFAPSPMADLHAPSRSPPSSHRATGPYGRYTYGPPPQYPHHQPSRSVPSSSLKASPVVTHDETQPRKLWSRESRPSSSAPSGSGMRVELGSSGKGLEGINKMMRAQTAPSPSSRHLPPHQHGRYPYHPHYPHSHSRSAPRMPPPTKYQASSRPTPSKSPILPSHPGVGRYPFGSHEKKSLPPTAKTASRLYSSQGKPATAKPAARPPEKENEKQEVVQRRSPCNCKKSRCLKLYCECFSAEIFCEGCNCTDCYNNGEHQEMRDKAMKETRSKNPKAFKPRLHLDSDNPAQSNHSMGCRCKKSECLKKYCECFQAGVFCAGKCKCKICANYAGSQKLIDKRRKMKDVRGADIAMRAAEEAWKGQTGPRKPPGHLPLGPSSTTPVASRRHLPSTMRPSPDPRSASSQLVPRPHYMGSSYMHHQRSQKFNYSPMGLKPVTPGFSGAVSRQRPPSAPSTDRALPVHGTKRSANKITPSVPPRTPAVRLEFDPSSSRKRRKKGDQDEATFSYFGNRVPAQPKTTALMVFSFLSSRDVYKAALVSKTWKSLAEDGELWQFP